MNNKSLSGVAKLANKVNGVLGAALALLATSHAKGATTSTSHAQDEKKSEIVYSGTRPKVMHLLKLNNGLSAQGTLVAMHSSHSSHSSHRSHASHRSHYSSAAI